MIKILITSAGGVNGINVIKALRRQHELPLFLVATDAEPLTVASALADKFYVTPSAKDPNFVSTLLRICKNEKIQIMLPIFSAEILELSKMQKEFQAHGIQMALPSQETAELAWDKRKTAVFFDALHIPQPKMYHREDLKDILKIPFPIFIKSNTGSGSKEARVIGSKEEFHYYFSCIRDPIVQEYIGGEEYTIDALVDLQGKMVAASPRIRLEVKGGLATKSITTDNKVLVRYTQKIIQHLKMAGPVNIQCKVHHGKPYFLEINTRFASGGLPLAVAAGFNIPLLIVKMLLGMPLGKVKLKKNLVMLRYWDALFMEKKKNHYSFSDFYHEFS